MLGARYVKNILLPALQYKNKLRKRSELEPMDRAPRVDWLGLEPGAQGRQDGS